MPDLTEDEFRDRLERFHEGRPLGDRPSIYYGPTKAEMREQEKAFLALFDDLDNLPPPPGPLFTEAEYQSGEILRDQHGYQSRYDRLIRARVDIEEALAEIDKDEPRYHDLMGKLADVRGRIEVELERSTDDRFRGFARIDEWRMSNKDDYNASRRTRERPNQMTPKAVLEAETPEQKAERQRQRERERKAEMRARKRAQSSEAGSGGST